MSFETKARFQAELPGVYFLDPTNLPSLTEYLAAAGRVLPGRQVLGAEKAGEGNMNCTVRVRTTGPASFIVKQARPWLEKYPQVPAPFDRTLMEGRFYQQIADAPEVSAMMPRLLWVDEVNRVLALEDLGAASDFFPLYSRETILEDDILVALTGYLAALHALPVDTAMAEHLRNAGMRRLNHEHIFDLPLRLENGLDANVYTPGLAAAGDLLKRDPAYRQVAAELGERYLHGTGRHLVHGDFFPGSFLRTAQGVRVIDPEFCFCGDAELDLGMFYGHLLLAGEPIARVDRMLALYQSSCRDANAFRPERARQYAGIEMMRRLLGLAQIPTLRADLDRKTQLLALSRFLVVGP